MKIRTSILCLLVGMLLGLLASPTPLPTQAALYWASVDGHSPLTEGVRGRDTSVCFVGNAIDSRTAMIGLVIDYLKDFEYAANIRFLALSGQRLQEAFDSNLNSLQCPAPTQNPDGTAHYDGDIRVVLAYTDVPRTGKIPGNGCADWNPANGGSWSNPPWELEQKRSCQYNLNLGDDPWCPSNQPWPCSPPSITPYRNHTLHEFGHAMGLAHEHERIDATCYDPNDDARWTNQGFMTPYDIHSVMHYKFTTAAGHTCNVNGNYDNTGFSDWDRLALHILYPEENRVAEFVGTTVVRAGETLSLQSAWKARGANTGFVASNWLWRLDGVTQSTTPDLNVVMNTPGTYNLQFSYSDFLGRTYAYSGPVRVLDVDDYAAQIAAPAAAQLPLLYPNHTVSISGGVLHVVPDVSLSFGSGVFSETVVLDYVPMPAADTGGLMAAGPIFGLQATYLSSGQPAQIRPGRTYSMAVTYQSRELPPGVNEEDLALFVWDTAISPQPAPPGLWVLEPTSMVSVRSATVSATPDHFSLWGIFGQPRLYLPMVLR